MSYTLTELDDIISNAEAKLKRMKDFRRKVVKKTKPKSNNSKGRPQIDQRLLERAKELAKKYPIPHVAIALNVSKTTLYNYGITRAALNKEK